MTWNHAPENHLSPSEENTPFFTTRAVHGTPTSSTHDTTPEQPRSAASADSTEQPKKPHRKGDLCFDMSIPPYHEPTPDPDGRLAQAQLAGAQLVSNALVRSFLNNKHPLDSLTV